MLYKKLLSIGLLTLFLGCQEDELVQEIQPLNSFSMNLDDRLWEPSIVAEDECMRTFQCFRSSVSGNNQEIPFYNIKAYKDPQAKSNFESENFMELQISDVQVTGNYEISGSYKEDFSSHVLFIVREPGGASRSYVNEVNGNSFVVEISEFIPIDGFSLPGIKGFFHGTLYNEDNPLDSLVFRSGEFTFKKINWFNFNQCAE